MILTKKQEKAMKRDFRNFAYVIWHTLDLPSPTPVQNDIAAYLQHGGRRIQISAFRGVTRGGWVSVERCR